MLLRWEKPIMKNITKNPEDTADFLKGFLLFCFSRQNSTTLLFGEKI